MYALVEISGKQYRAEKGGVLKVDKLPQAKGESVEFTTVLMVREDEDVKIGAPYVEGASVKTTIADHGRDKKILVYKRKRRKNYSRTRGHRQSYTMISVNEISGA